MPSDVLLQRFSVPYEYPVVFTDDVFADGNPALAEVLSRREPDKRHRLFVILDAGVERATPGLRQKIESWVAPRNLALVEVQTIEGGERVKNDAIVVPSLHARFHALGIDRHSFVVAIGGGSLLDAAGYAAATAHRGIRIVRLPTTVLGQNDSGVGVKNGVNAFGVKNFIGAFAPPFAVVNDAKFLETLTRRDRIAGMAEAVKVALVRDADFFAWIEANARLLNEGDRAATSRMIRRSAELHLAHIAGGGDPFEQGSARPLDFGHWSAHKLESLTHHELRHGEAVAIGMALDLRFAALTGRLDPAEAERIVALLGRLGLPTWNDALEDPRLLAGLDEFREHLGGELTITILEAVGRGVEIHDVDTAVVKRAIGLLGPARAA